MRERTKEVIKIIFLLIFLLGSLFLIFSISNETESEKAENKTLVSNETINYKNFSITFVYLSEDEKQIFLDYLNQVKSHWFFHTTEIYVSGSRDTILTRCRNVFDPKPGVVACNDNDGRVTYWYTNQYTETELKRIICHELAHTIVTERDLPIEEKIVEDIQESCYE